MKLQYCLTGILCLFLKSDAQQIKPLTVGDKVPAVAIKNIYNYPASSSNLSAFKNKLVILDFMTTYCSSCLKALPRFDSLKKMYGDKVQVFLVTYEKKEKIKKFLQNRTWLKLPIIVEDTLLKKYFPHIYISHEVWIKDGMVKAITEPEYVTGNNIETLLAGNSVSWPVKRDAADPDYTRPLFAVNENIDRPVFYSALSGHIPDVAVKYLHSTDSSKGITKMLMVNLPVIDLYLYCYGKRTYPSGHILLKVNDTSRYIYNRVTGYKDVWKQKHTFCYEAVLPQELPAEAARNKMLFDLDLYLGTNGRMEKTDVPAYVLRRTDTVLRLVSKEVSRVLTNKEGSAGISLTALLFRLNHSGYGIPAFDETGLSQKLYLNLSRQALYNIPLLQKELSRYGLQLIKEVREAEMFVLQENNLPTKK